MSGEDYDAEFEQQREEFIVECSNDILLDAGADL